MDMCLCAVCDLLVYGMCSVYMFGTYVYMCDVWCMWYVQMCAISGVCVCVCLQSCDRYVCDVYTFVVYAKGMCVGCVCVYMV